MSLTWADDTLEVYTEASGTFTFNDSDVEWAYVDWDDGEDNSLEKAIYQWKELDTDSNAVTLTHTYTKTGSFYPVVRTVNNAGYLSKYFYDNNKSDNTTIPKPKQEVTNITGMTMSDGNPLPVLKVENRSVKSGIDNSIFEEGPKEVYIFVPPVLASGNTVLSKTCTLKVKYLEASLRFAGLGSNDRGNYDLGYEGIVKEVEKSFSLATGGKDTVSLLGNVMDWPDTPTKALDILEVKLLTPRIDTAKDSVRNDFNKLKFFLIAQGDDTKWYPITYVSNGDPIKKSEDRRVTLDFSQSRAKASNTSVSGYRFDDGKVFWNPVNEWQALSNTNFTNTTQTPLSVHNNSYTYYTRPGGLLGSSSIGGSSSVGLTTGSDFFYDTRSKLDFVRDQFPLNEYNQFYEQYHLARITASSSGVKNSDLDTFKGMYRITPALQTQDANGYYLDSATTTSIQTSGAYYNNSGNIINTNNWNNMSFYDNDGGLLALSEYFIITNETKTNKIFFNNTPYAKEFMSNLTTTTSGNRISGVFYLRLRDEVPGDKFTQTAEWVPLKFKDTTKVSKEIRDSTNEKYITYQESMTKPGFLEYDMPDDWSKVSISGLCGGLFNVTSAAVIPPTTYGKEISAKLVGGVVEMVPSYNLQGGQYILSTSALSTYTDEQIGNFKYIYQYSGGAVSTPAASGQAVYWVVSSSVVNNKLFLLSSSAEKIVGAQPVDFSGVMRRVNAYEVFDGAPKVITGVGEGAPNVGENPYPYTFMWNSSAFKSELQANFVDIYPLKVVLAGPYPSGASLPGTGSHFVSGSSKTGMEMWNALPYNNSYSQVVMQSDNTAYDLSYIAITSDVSMVYAGTYYQAISKKGKVFIKRTGTPIQSINFGGNAMGDEQSFSANENYTTYGTLRLLRRIEAEGIRVMWDEQQKDSTYVRFFGYVSNVNETHQVAGKRASRPFTFSLIVEEICLLDTNGNLMSDVEPLGGSPDDKGYE